MERRKSCSIFVLCCLVLFISAITCCAEEKMTSPTMTTWMPEIGQSHHIGYLSTHGGLNWIPTWTVEKDQAPGTMLETYPIDLAKGRYAVLFQVWHKEYDGVRLGELRAWSGAELIASSPLISREFPSYRDGGFQRAILEVDLAGPASDVRFELYYDGVNTSIWTGTVNLSAIETRRPFYNIAHRCSTVDKVNRMVDKNANAIEFDLTPVEEDGIIGFKVYHSGDIFFTPASRFDDFLQNLKAHIDKRNIALIELDCKQDKDIDPADYARALAQRLMDAGIPARLAVFSVPRAQAAIFNDVLKKEDADGHILYNAGIDSYLQDYSGLTADTWAEKVEAIGSTFIGVGASSVHPSSMPSWMSWVQAMTNMRDANGNFKKSYYWTLNRKASMRSCLDYGVDGVITNFPDRMDEVLNEEPYSLLFRRATQDDSQFEVHGF
ncbi:plc-like phosphodiesterase tim beta/alpha-barrel domain [Desulfoluna butyratoxydans]|uniref:Plc-like phosphodiesterase tim beta/alpha-barrel domain n=2 Tax=Desulfoluna butyratoxydans TaxID=231438 RepID=A0A4U8YR23_9BACT|nr:plc-like phosphodiesterase tim beta/alpha-barrel domain [Desulfoluna butyratoxydans]